LGISQTHFGPDSSLFVVLFPDFSVSKVVCVSLFSLIVFYHLALGFKQSIDHFDILMANFSLSELFKTLVFVYDTFAFANDSA
jgi:hypothetical protein